MARQHLIYGAVVNAALHHAEDVYLVRVAYEGAPAVDRERHVGRYFDLVMVAHRRQHFLFIAPIDALPVKESGQYLSSAIAVVETRAVLKGLIITVLGKPRRVVQQPHGVGKPGVILLAPFKRLGDRRGQPLHAEAVPSLELLHPGELSPYPE